MPRPVPGSCSTLARMSCHTSVEAGVAYGLHGGCSSGDTGPAQAGGRCGMPEEHSLSCRGSMPGRDKDFLMRHALS